MLLGGAQYFKKKINEQVRGIFIYRFIDFCGAMTPVELVMQ